jgi:hypothetical protein
MFFDYRVRIAVSNLCQQREFISWKVYEFLVEVSLC